MNWALHPCPLIPDFTRLRVCNRKRGRPFKLKSRIRTKKKLSNEWQVVCLTGPTQSTSGQWQSISRFNSFIRILLSTRLSWGCRSHRGDFSIDFFFEIFFFENFLKTKKWKRPHPIEKVLRATAYLVNQGPCAIFLSLGSPPHLPVPHWSAVEHLNTKEKGRVKLSIKKKKRQTLVVFSPKKNSKNSTEICFNQQPLMGSAIGVNGRPLNSRQPSRTLQHFEVHQTNRWVTR